MESVFRFKSMVIKFIIIFIDGLINSVINCFNKYFDFKTRSSRREFWHWQFFRLFSLLPIIGIESLGFKGASIFFAIIFLIPDISVQVRRFHDCNITGWLYLIIILLMIISFFYQLLFLFCFTLFILLYLNCLKGSDGANNYGEKI